MRLIDADAFSAEMKKRQDKCAEWRDETDDNDIKIRADGALSAFIECKLTLEKMPTVEPDMAQYLAYECGKDSVQVVRCKDCEHSYDDIGGTFCSYGVCVGCMVEEDFFCSDGERRET